MLTDSQKDTLLEIINIGVGKASNSLNLMLGSHILLSVPSLEIYSRKSCEGAGSAIKSRFNDNILSSVRLIFKGSFSGRACLLFPTDSASKLVEMIIDRDGDDFDEDEHQELDDLKRMTLSEIGNVFLNYVMGMIGEMLHDRIEYQVPDYVEGGIEEIVNNKEQDDNVVILAQTHFLIKDLQVSGEVLLIFTLESFSNLLKLIDNISEDDE